MCTTLTPLGFLSCKDTDFNIDSIERFTNESLRILGVSELPLSGKHTNQPRDYHAGNGKESVRSLLSQHGFGSVKLSMNRTVLLKSKPTRFPICIITLIVLPNDLR